MNIGIVQTIEIFKNIGTVENIENIETVGTVKNLQTVINIENGKIIENILNIQTFGYRISAPSIISKLSRISNYKLSKNIKTVEKNSCREKFLSRKILQSQDSRHSRYS